MVRFLRILGYAILRGCYLINRMSSPVLNDKIPHSILFSHDPLHSLLLRFLGHMLCS